MADFTVGERVRDEDGHAATVRYIGVSRSATSIGVDAPRTSPPYLNCRRRSHSFGRRSRRARPAAAAAAAPAVAV